MGRTHWAWGVAATALAWPLQAQDAGRSLAVLPFENTGSYGQDKEVSEALQLGIPAMLSSALAAHPGLRVADPSRVRQELEAQHLRPAGRVDAATAGQVGKAVGARYTRLQDRSQLGLIISAVSEKIVAATGLPASPTSSGTGDIPTEALTQYSRGLLYESRGDKSKAADAYQHALSAYPEYPDAREALRRVR